jgi:trehalose 6-phosphate phosphatase
MAEARAAAAGARRRRPPRRPGPPPPLDTGAALFLDIDGTLLELAPTPALVHVHEDVTERLPALARELDGAVALITGRAIADADGLFPGLSLPMAGQHGTERRSADGTIHRHRLPQPGIARLRRELARFAARHPGVTLEDKGATLALHYRQAPRLAAHVHRTMRAQVAAGARGRAWRVQPGKGIVELRPDGRDKGTAIAEFMAEPPFRGRMPVFLGDDRTDEFGFAAVARMGGWSVKVGAGPTRARYRLPDVAAVRRWIAAVVTVPVRRVTTSR